MIELTIPFPPSGNHRLMVGRGKLYRSPLYKHFLLRVLNILATEKLGCFEGGARLGMRLMVYPPDKRRRDLDNVVKTILDALKNGAHRVYEDDYDLWHLEVNRGEVDGPHGRVECRLWRL